MDSLGPLVIPPFGVSPLGLFDAALPVAPPTPPPGFLADLVDYGPSPSEPLRKPSFEIRSLTKGMHPVDEQVCIALSRVKGSGAAVQSEGSDFLSVGKLDAGAPTVLVSEARLALKRLDANGDIEIVRLAVDVVDDTAALALVYRNLRSPDRSRVRTLKRRFPAEVGR